MQQDIINGFRLSSQQTNLWSQQGDATPFYAQCAVQIDGPLDIAALKSAVQHVVDEHAILRTTFARLPGMQFPVQVVNPDGVVTWQMLGTTDMVNATNGRHPINKSHVCELCLDLFKELRRRPPDLTEGPLIHCALLPLPESSHLLLISLPALCADGWSMNNLVRAIGDAYGATDAAPSMSEEEALQYVQFAEWQHEMLADEDDEDGIAGRAFWRRQQLADYAPLTLPFANATARQVGDPERLTILLDDDLVASIDTLAARYDTTSAAVLCTCWQMLLHRLTRASSMVLNLTVTGRQHEMLFDTLGLFTRQLPMPCHVAAHIPFHDLLARTSQSMNEVDEWQDYFTSPDPPAPTIGFDYAEWPAAVQNGTITLTICEQRTITERFNLQLACQRKGSLVRATFQFDPMRFRQDDIARLARSFATLVRDVTYQPESLVGDVDLLGEQDRQQLLVAFNDTTAEIADGCLHQLFAEQAARTPDNVAVVCEEEQLTYAQLNAQANQLAHYLQTMGVGPDTAVGLCMERSSAMIVGVLGILKAGGAYVPLDPMYPLERLAYTLQDVAKGSTSPLLLTQQRLAQNLASDAVNTICIDADWHTIAQQPTKNPGNPTTPDNLAYIIYTSGSTGQPKGVMIRHGAAVNLAMALRHEVYGDAILDQDRALRISLNAPLTFDSSVKQLVQLLHGHTLHVVPEEARPDGQALLAFAHDQKLDVLDCTPAQLRLILDAGLGQQPDRDPKLALIGGEAINEAIWSRLASSRTTHFYNVYGPTECTVNATTCAIRFYPESPTIGRPITNAQLYILDEQLRPVPVGVPGELYIGGAGLARGYVSAPSLTATRFIPHPFTEEVGARLYRTGDLAAYSGDGSVTFLGRADHQVKLRGFRIELGEIEAILNQHPIVRESAVIVREDTPDDPRLVAYMVENSANGTVNGASANGASVNDASANGLSANGSTAPVDLRTFLRLKLPEYMIPSTFVPLPELPLSRNGKVDRRALPVPESIRPASPRVFVAPRNHFEQTIAQVWQEVLQVDKVGADDNFFDLGGHSLLMVKVHHGLRTALDRDISLMDMFRNPTVALLAQHFSQHDGVEPSFQKAQARGESRKTSRDRQRARRQKRRAVNA